MTQRLTVWLVTECVLPTTHGAASRGSPSSRAGGWWRDHEPKKGSKRVEQLSGALAVPAQYRDAVQQMAIASSRTQLMTLAAETSACFIAGIVSMQQPAAAAALRWPTLLPPMSQAANQLVGSRRQSASAAAAHKMQNSQHQLLKTFRTKTSFPQ